MSLPIGRNGLAKASPGDAEVKVLTFTATGSVTKQTGLDPNKSYRVFSSSAGPSNVTLAVTGDSPASFKAGTCAWGADRTPTVAAIGDNVNVYIGHIAKGCSGAKVTHSKNGAGTDNAGKVTTLGGRFQMRFVPFDDPVTDESGTTDFVPAATV